MGAEEPDSVVSSINTFDKFWNDCTRMCTTFPPSEDPVSDFDDWLQSSFDVAKRTIAGKDLAAFELQRLSPEEYYKARTSRFESSPSTATAVLLWTVIPKGKTVNILSLKPLSVSGKPRSRRERLVPSRYGHGYRL